MLRKLLLLFGLFAVPAFASAQASPSTSGGYYTYAPVTTTGQLGKWLTFVGGYAPPSYHTIDWSNTGTAPIVCTFEVDGSTDSVHWYGLTASTSCTSGGMFHIAYKPVVFLRINVLTYTAGDSTTAVIFNYTRGQQ